MKRFVRNVRFPFGSNFCISVGIKLRHFGICMSNPKLLFYIRPSTAEISASASTVLLNNRCLITSYINTIIKLELCQTLPIIIHAELMKGMIRMVLSLIICIKITNHPFRVILPANKRLCFSLARIILVKMLYNGNGRCDEETYA